MMSKIIRLGYPVNFQKAKLPSKKKLMGHYTILEPLQIKKHSIDLFKNFSKDKKGIDWIYMPQGPFKNEISLNTCNVIWRRSSIEEQRFNETIVYADEWEFYSRLIANGLEGKQISQTLLYARKHSDSTTYEFSTKDEKRTSSKKKAIVLVASNLRQKNLLSNGIQQYLINQAIGFRDFDLLRKLQKIKPLKSIRQYGVYLVYPMWKLIKRNLK